VRVVSTSFALRQGRTLMVVKEFWWAGSHGKDIRSTHWAHLGRRNDALGWMREQERALERASEAYAEAPSAASADVIPRR